MLERELEVATSAARRAGSMLRERANPTVLKEHGRDVKLLEDTDSEAVIFQMLGNEYPILSEESGETGNLPTRDLYWVVDPLDGTYNYSRGVPLACISIALCRGETPQLGVIYDFWRDEVFSGVRVTGARCNDRRISISETGELKSAVMATGIPLLQSTSVASLGLLAERMRRAKKVRMLGSAALSLAYVACGRMDIYAESNIMLWDVAAGLALVAAAGGSYSVRPGTEQNAVDVIAANDVLLREFSSAEGLLPTAGD